MGLGYGLNKTSNYNEPYNFVVIGYKFYIKGFSICSVRSPKKIRAEKFVCLRADLLALGVIHTCEWPLKNPSNVFIYGFQGVFNANVFSVLAVHIESKMIICTSGLLPGFRLFSGKFAYDYAFVWKIAVLL